MSYILQACVLGPVHPTNTLFAEEAEDESSPSEYPEKFQCGMGTAPRSKDRKNQEQLHLRSSLSTTTEHRQHWVTKRAHSIINILYTVHTPVIWWALHECESKDNLPKNSFYHQAIGLLTVKKL